MTTNDNFLNVTTKRILGVDDFQDRFFDYLKNSILDTTKRMFGSGMVFDSALTIGGGVDSLSISGTSLSTDGDGHILDVANAYQGTSASFENENAVDYYVGLHYCEVPQTIQVNPRTGQPEYAEFIEEVGLSGTPDSVTDNGNDTITFSLNTLLETGVDHSGRYVTVYKATPDRSAVTDTIAIETVQVAYNNPNNTITTTGTFGQSTVSTTAADYVVILRGPVVKRNTDLRSESGYAFVGIATGVGAGGTPTAFDTDDQQVLPNSWFSSVFEGFAGDLFPATDNTYDLGKSDKTWANIYTSNLSVAGSFLPVNDGTQNLGGVGKNWNNLYITGLVNGDLRPQGSGIYDLGSASTRWGDVYCMRLQINSYVYGSLTPGTDNTYDLGASGRAWKDFYIAGDVYGNFTPGTDNTYDLGGASNSWKDIYLSGEVYGDLIPDTANANDLGSATKAWKDLHIDGNVHGSLIPPTTAYDLGSSADEWGEVHCRNFYTVRVDTSLIPNGSIQLGDAANEWNNGFINNLYVDGITGSNSTTVTFNSTLFTPSAPSNADLGDATNYWDDIYVSATRTNWVFPLTGSTISLNGGFTLQVDDTHALGSSSLSFSAMYTHILSTDLLEARFGSNIEVKDGDNIIAQTANNSDLGSASNYFGEGYFEKLYANTIQTRNDTHISLATDLKTKNVVPDTDDTLDLGSSSLRYRDIYIGRRAQYTSDDTGGGAWVERWIGASECEVYEHGTGFVDRRDIVTLTDGGAQNYLITQNLANYNQHCYFEFTIDKMADDDPGLLYFEVFLVTTSAYTDANDIIYGRMTFTAMPNHQDIDFVTVETQLVNHNVSTLNNNRIHKLTYNMPITGVPFSQRDYIVACEWQLANGSTPATGTYFAGCRMKYRAYSSHDWYDSNNPPSSG